MSVLKKTGVGAVLLAATAFLGGCYYAPAPRPVYYAYHPAYYPPPPAYGGVVVGGGYYRHW